MISNFLHALAHRWDSSPCRCELAAYQRAWIARRDAEERRQRLIREEGLPTNPDDFEQWLRERVA